MNRLIVNGADVPVSFPVVTWKDKGGLRFDSGFLPRASVRPSGGVNLFVLHWDVCPSSKVCCEALKQRGLSVHLMLDADGTVYQALDLQTVAAYHCAGSNARSVGVEICNPVTPAKGSARPVVQSHGINGGKSFSHLDFFDAQKVRTVELAEAVCVALNIPRKLPGTLEVPRQKLLAASAFQGVCGHYHMSDQKSDPGLTLWPAFKAAGW